MSIEDFDEDCFVAFTDISGFKEMMKGGGSKAIRAIDRFYSAGYRALQEHENVNGLFVSDCGILFSRRRSREGKLSDLLEAIRSINRRLLNDDLMLTTSIAWGRFSYQNRIRFVGIEKQPIYGDAYTRAYLDNEVGRPRIQPGECRILRSNFSDDLVDELSTEYCLEKSGHHHYFYWMVDGREQIPNFKARYHDAYSLKYSGMLSALKMRRHD